jgi:hypothetical protein
MYFSAIKKAINSIEEKIFYDIAVLFLTTKGYNELEIIDGKGDGGRDVKCSRTDIRIQLSVIAKWEAKLNKEAENTKKAGITHFIYVTNRLISEAAREAFFNSLYKFKGVIEITILDINAISTALSNPANRQAACSLLGMVVDKTIHTGPREVALSNLLLFSDESRELRDNIVEANIAANLLETKVRSKQDLMNIVIATVKFNEPELLIKKVLGRMIAQGRVCQDTDNVYLSPSELAIAEAARDDYVLAIQDDRKGMTKKYSISEADVDQLINVSLEILAKGQEKDVGSHSTELLNALISKFKLTDRKKDLYSDLAKLNVARVTQYGKTLDHIQKTNTFDIYRALGSKTDLNMVLDSSVAMPLIFGLAFKTSFSRYGVAAVALEKLCKSHQIKMVVPDFYLNEMVHHGLQAQKYIDQYNDIPEEIKDSLMASENAYLSHFSYIRATATTITGEPLTLEGFLKSFGITNEYRENFIEKRIADNLGQFGIAIVKGTRPDLKILSEIEALKSQEAPIIKRHDAQLVKLIDDNQENGYIFATWDRVMIKYMEGSSRVLADTPARITDFLSMARGAQYESDQSTELLTSLIHCDEKKLAAMAQKIEMVMKADQMHQLRDFSEEEREKHGKFWKMDGDALDFFVKSMKEADIDNDANR